MQSYDYARRDGVLHVSWEDFGRRSRLLAERLAAHRIDAVVGLARGGLFPATAVACALRRDLYPARVSRRTDDEVVRSAPEWSVEVPAHLVRGRAIALVDEIADSGETLRLVAERLHALGASRVVTAALVAHSWAKPVPDVVATVSDALVVWPWDAEVWDGRGWVTHPEYVAATGREA